MGAAATTAPPANMNIATTRSIASGAARQAMVLAATIHPRRSTATVPAATSASGAAPPPTAPAATTARPGSMRSKSSGKVKVMTENERNQVLQLLKGMGIPNCFYERGDFFLFRGRSGHLFLKEGSSYIGFYGVDYLIMREWAEKRLREAINKNATIFNAWRFVIGQSRPSGQKAVWFTLRGVQRHWFAQRQAVINVVVTLYRILSENKIFSEDFNVGRFRNNVMPQGNCLAMPQESKGSNVEIAGVKSSPLLQCESNYGISWNGWKSFYNYWDDFVKNWYNSEASPKDPLTQSLASSFNLKNPSLRFDIRELPEPYYGRGDTEKCKCVIVHLNPGASCDGEDLKIFGGNGNLIRSFKEECCKEYSRYAEKWSCLRASYEDCDAKVPGHDWWHEDNRVRFIDRFWGVKDLAEVFALEACPYHSKNWTSGLNQIAEHIIDKVITPAALVANRNKNCAVFVGNEFNGLISKIKGVKAIRAWKGTRVYSLYKLILPSSMGELGNGNMTYLLVINGVRGMWLPAADKRNIEIEKKICEIVNVEVS